LLEPFLPKLLRQEYVTVEVLRASIRLADDSLVIPIEVGASEESPVDATNLNLQLGPGHA
jgi:hypothetical protein